MKITPNPAVMAAAREQLVLLEALVDDLRCIADPNTHERVFIEQRTFARR